MTTFFGILLAIVAAVVFAFMVKSRASNREHLRRLRANLSSRGTSPADIEEAVKRENITFPRSLSYGVLGLLAFGFVLIGWDQTFFYAEPGYVYHVRTIFSDEKVVSDVGWNTHYLGRINAWKRAMTVQTSLGYTGAANTDEVNAETESDTASVNLPPLNMIFLDQVDADIEATARFSLPTDRDTFLKMAHEYRSPENLLRTALIPAFKETLQATGSLMSAEAYYSGGRTEFNTEFERQMQNGIYLVRRIEHVLKDETAQAVASANAALATDQSKYGEDTKVVFEVEKILGPDGLPKRKPQSFNRYGIQVVDARVTDVKPNAKFVERMQLKQKASADRAIAREQRVQEEEQRLLAIAKGEREVAERQASAKVEQIQKTTDAETTKQLAITAASQRKAEAEIDRDTSKVKLEQAKIDAQAVKVAADAEAYQKEAVLSADNALAQKLAAEIEIQRTWSEALAKRNVPGTVFNMGGGTGDGPSIGSDLEFRAFMQMLTMDAAKRLNYTRDIDKKVSETPSK